MASSLVRRICQPAHDEVPLSLEGVMAVFFEIRDGRFPSAAMDTWLSTDEKADAQIIIDALVADTLDPTVVRGWLVLGELQILSIADVETRLGLN